MSAPARYGTLAAYLPLFIRLAPATHIGYEIVIEPKTGFPVTAWHRRAASPEVFQDADALEAWIDANEYRWLNGDHDDD